ncbi:MAG: GNAT family N-acetyltransferase [Lactobacillus sp.]|jgi:RimJ/RimL family protein N-acetyltransferase|nr:GNAT family N-acetyltransferase [Lactobacillus sp.]
MTQASELIIREAIPDDAANLLAYLKQVQSESELLLITAEDYSQSVTYQANALADIYDSPNNTLLLALLGEEIVGMLRLSAEEDPHIQHIAEVGISVLKARWGQRIGTYLLADGVQWAKDTQILKRLELTVQARNQRAINLYQKIGFDKEGQMARGFYDPAIGYLDVWLMGYLID